MLHLRNTWLLLV